MKFDCPTCEVIRHVEECDGDPREDRCWHCGTLVPYTTTEIERWKAEGWVPPEDAARLARERAS